MPKSPSDQEKDHLSIESKPKGALGNQLSNASSPYLLQHADNPVHWWQWGSDALTLAQRENKPIVLSIGYAACHWCHVMAHESFEDQETADLMNHYFINIKVDREERPDVDQIYMAALHVMGEQGGWPLTMFLTPKGEPFWGGTYFPLVRSHGRPSFKDVLFSIQKSFYEEPDNISQNVFHVKHHLENRNGAEKSDEMPMPAQVKKFSEDILGLADWVNGGIKGAPKFPNAPINEAMLRGYKSFGNEQNRDAFLQCIRSLCQGGIYDHVGGGLARYATDNAWLVPHFEKMLYDNAHFLRHLTWGYGITKDQLFATRIDETVNWLIREMRLENGCFSASLDADSEGVEGKFYVWQLDEIETCLGDEAAFFIKNYDVSGEGNWEGANILNCPLNSGLLNEGDEKRLKACRDRLLDLRETRTRPALDDKILVDWNAYLIRALVEAGLALDRSDYLELAAKAYKGIMDLAKNGKLPHSYRAGASVFPCFSSDYAGMINAACSLYEAMNEPQYLIDAEDFAAIMHDDYRDGEGGFYLTNQAADDLIFRPRGDQDEANPSANSQILEGFLRLNALLANRPLEDAINQLVKNLNSRLKNSGFGSAGFMNGLNTYFSMKEVLVIATSREAAKPYLDLLHKSPEPARIIRLVLEQSELLDYQRQSLESTVEHSVTVLICQNQSCQMPIHDLADLEKLTKP